MHYGYLFFIDFVISFFVLLAIHAPWWAWLIYILSVLVWIVIWALRDGGTKGNTINKQKRDQE